MKKKVCLITGGAGFLGKNFCKFFLEKNFTVICVDNNRNNISKLKSLNLEDLIIFNCDISNNYKVEKLFNKLNKSYPVDVLINNAAIDAVPYKNNGRGQKFPTTKMWDKEMDSSLKGAFLMIKFFGEEMAKRKSGSIINIGSDLSVIAPNQKIYKSSYNNYIKPVTYSVIKHGMVGLTKYFASLYGEKKVRVNMVSPGPVKNKQEKKLLKQIENMTPFGRLGNPKDLFGLLFFLASENSSYITGQNIIVDGGKTSI